jgi:hypothetical protein
MVWMRALQRRITAIGATTCGEIAAKKARRAAGLCYRVEKLPVGRSKIHADDAAGHAIEVVLGNFDDLLLFDGFDGGFDDHGSLFHGSSPKRKK